MDDRPPAPRSDQNDSWGRIVRTSERAIMTTDVTGRSVVLTPVLPRRTPSIESVSGAGAWVRPTFGCVGADLPLRPVASQPVP